MRSSVASRGYTLVELIVSVAIFSMVMLVASAALLTLISLDRQARATNDVVANLSYVVDSMARSVRTGTGYSCAGSGDCPGGASSFTFTDYQGRTVTYSKKGDGTIGECINSCGTPVSLTDPRIQIQTMTFYVFGSTRSDAVQPRVLFTVTGSLKPDARAQPVTFTIESSATQRLIDI